MYYVVTSKLTFRTPKLSLKYIKRYSFAYHELKFEGISLIIVNRKTKCSVVSGSHSFQCFFVHNMQIMFKRPVKTIDKQESPPAWTQEAYRPSCSQSEWECGQTDGWMDGQTRVKTLPSPILRMRSVIKTTLYECWRFGDKYQGVKQFHLLEPSRSGRMVTALCSPHRWSWVQTPNLHQCLWTRLQVCKSKRLSCHTKQW